MIFLPKIAEGKAKFFPQHEATCLPPDMDSTGTKLDDLIELIQSIMDSFKQKVLT